MPLCVNACASVCACTHVCVHALVFESHTEVVNINTQEPFGAALKPTQRSSSHTGDTHWEQNGEHAEKLQYTLTHTCTHTS